MDPLSSVSCMQSAQGKCKPLAVDPVSSKPAVTGAADPGLACSGKLLANLFRLKSKIEHSISAKNRFERFSTEMAM